MKKLILTIVLAALCLFWGNASQAQTIKITGVITDQQGKTLSDATVQIVNQNIKTKSNIDGTFTINSPIQSGKLKVSYLGYHDKEISFNINSLNRLSVVLETINDVLKEVEINTGYYTVKDKERTGSISRVSAETIGKQPVSNPLAALIGRMPGVNIEQQSGVNGGGFKVEIRGVNSLRPDGRQPLYLIDGVPYPANPLTNASASVSGLSTFSSPLNYISPADIESIEILKDADATAIYGSRGANGVVLIRTKSAKSGKTKIDVNVAGGISTISRKLDLLNTEQYLEMRTEAFKNDGAAIGATDYDLNGTWDKNRYTDWQEVLIGGTARNINGQGNISGGNEFTQFSIRTNYNKQTTVSQGDFADQKGSGTITVNHTSTNRKFKLNFSSTFGIDQNTLPVFDLTSFINLAPNAPDLFDKKGDLNWALNGLGAATWINPIASTRNIYSGKTNNLLSNGTLNYEVLPGLSLRSTLGYTSIRLKENVLRPILAQAPSLSATGTNRMAFNTVETWILEPQIDYKKSLGKGTISILIGSTFQKDDQHSETLAGGGYTSDLLLDNMTVAPSKAITATSTQYKYIALFTRINYAHQENYFINLTGRRDGSSKFGPGKQFGNFGAAGLAWIFSNEKLFKEIIPAISFGKLRTSYGITGSDQIPNYGYLETYSATNYPYTDGSGLFPTRLANPDYSWETVKKMEAALDLGFLHDRIMISASWYRNRSSNQLVGYTLPDVTGFPSIQYNLPATVENTGWEFELHSSNISLKDFRWKTSFNLTIPKNKLVAYPNIAGSTYANTYTVGESLYTPKVWYYTGVNPQTGVYTFRDFDGNGNDIDAVDRITSNEALATRFYGGLQNSLTYRNFQLDIFFQFANKTVYNPFNSFASPGFIGNQLIDVMQRWQKPGDVADFQKFSQMYGTDQASLRFTYRGASNAFADASFIKLKNISLSWNAPIGRAAKAGLKSLSIYLQGQNLLTITKYPGDPEIMNILTLPSLRTIVVGLNLGF